MSLCLNMIVKNESHIIQKTLKNICDNFPIDYWVISDTGSTDNTIEIIENFFQLQGIDGFIHSEPWKDFSYNRNAALNACIGKSDYVLIFDADDKVVGEIKLPELVADAYFLKFTSESLSIQYLRKLIIKNNGNYRWRGVLHEFLENDNEGRVDEVTGDYAIISGRTGSRNRKDNKYLDDAVILEKAYNAGEELDLLPRYAFYCAQSYKDAGKIDQAIDWYKRRCELANGWYDEIYCSYDQLGLLYETRDDFKEAIYYWQEGVKFDPKRAECWYNLTRRHSWDNQIDLAYCYAKQASEIAIPEGNRLFINKPIYLYWLYYELCLNAYKIGKIEESYNAFKKMTYHCPQDLVNRLAYQVPAYKELISEDKFIEVKALSLNLTRLNRLDLLN
ncbi:glycosyltransferase [Psychrobacter pygoscelis]|uniref:glycosyltransferase n=1 Tax=Psychrobacter pygoscelis TaxID=2488563 RepID=UPI00103BBCD9|nr:glycosyltransferase [Psychrobacter pygoscelis]